MGNALEGFDDEAVAAAVPHGHHQFALVVRINQPHQVAQHDAVFVPQAGAGQQHGGQLRIVQINGDAGGDEHGFAGADGFSFGNAGAQIQACAAGGGILRQLRRNFGAEDFQLDLWTGGHEDSFAMNGWDNG